MLASGLEVQARKKPLILLQEETKKVFDSARDLSAAVSLLLAGKESELQSMFTKIMKAEDSVENSRRALTREVAGAGMLMMKREDILRAAYDIEDIAGDLTGIAFRLSVVDPQAFKKARMVDDFKMLIDMAVESVQRLDEMVRALPVNPASAIETAHYIQKLERRIDDKYRSVVASLMNIESYKDIIILKDIVESVEELSDLCLSAADSITIVAFGL